MQPVPKQPLAVRLRVASRELRIKPYPLMLLIPLLQEAADALDAHQLKEKKS
jgi:hypothetical protein